MRKGSGEDDPLLRATKKSILCQLQKKGRKGVSRGGPMGKCAKRNCHLRHGKKRRKRGDWKPAKHEKKKEAGLSLPLIKKSALS